MKWSWSNLNLQAKFRLLALAGLVLWLFNFSIIFFQINYINKITLSLERFEDLYNSVLEIRRYEKNFLLYKDRDSLDETVSYFQQARELYAGIAADEETASVQDLLRRLSDAFQEYRTVLDLEQGTGTPSVTSEETQEKIRTIGKRMVDLSQELLAYSRSHVADAAANAVRWPLLITGLILVLFAVGAVLVNRKVINPLVELERATEKIGRGDFGPIHHSARIESEVDRLVIAFNRMVEELEARQEQIIHSRKIASLGTLVSGVAHELNNPINNIILTIDTLTGGRQIAEERRVALLQDILAQAIRASGIVKNLLDFSRAEASALQDVDLAQLLKETLQIAGNQIALGKILLRQQIEPGLPAVRGNRQGLQQVFLNLVINAVQAMPAGGQLAVRASADENQRISVVFEDSGTGISAEHMPHIFDPFFTTKEVGQGTGLGLSVSYGIIKKHGGCITVNSSPGKGSKFTVVIPTREKTIDG
jgi:two-component system, NtrC family, sensor kinase